MLNVGRVAEAAESIDGTDDAGGFKALSTALLEAKFSSVGSVWVMDARGRLVSNPDPRISAEEAETFGDKLIELTQVRQPMALIGEKTAGSKIALRDVLGKYEEGIGMLEIGDETRVVAFRSMPDKGWVVGVDEPFGAAYSSTASLKRYIFWTCAVLGLCIIFSTAISISFIIKPYYRQQVALSNKIVAANANLTKLHALSVGMQKHLDLDKRISDVLSVALEVVGLDRLFIFMPTDGNTMLQCRGSIGNHDEAYQDICVPADERAGAIGRAYKNKETFRITGGRVPAELRLAAPYSTIKALRSREFVAIPLIVDNECVGVVTADNQLSKIPITDENIASIELFTSQAAVAIQNANMYAMLREHADTLEVTDHLTKAFTFAHFKELAGAGLERARADGLTLSIGTISFENFADYNRIVGHGSGDLVLTRVAQVIKENTSADEVVGRCFGTTFGVLFVGESVGQAETVVEQILSDLKGQEFVGQERLEEGALVYCASVTEYSPMQYGSLNDYITNVLEGTRAPPTQLI
jgi:diguanylate cyclase (GGDEF)-like protein